MTARAIVPPNAASDAFVKRGRHRLASLLSSEKFDAPVWATDRLAKTTAARTQATYFTRHGSTTEALPAVYAEPVKAWVVLGGGTASRFAQRSFAARWLWRGIEQRLGEQADTAFAWADLRHADAMAAEQLMLDAGLALRNVNKAASTLSDLVRVLALAGVCPAISYSPMTPRQGDSNTHRMDDPESRGDNVLTEAATNALADIFVRAVTMQDRFYSSQMALMIATGFRWNESATLPLAPMEKQEVETRDVTGALCRVPITYIRRHKAKSGRAGGNGRPNSELQQLSPAQGTLASMAVELLRELCAPAREVAARLEQTAPKWVWPSQLKPEYIRKRDLVLALGLSNAGASGLLNAIGEPDPESPRVSHGAIRRVSLADFEQYMTGRQNWSLLAVVKAGAGRKGQFASESLVCLRVNELHQSRATLPLIGRPSHTGLITWLGGRPDEGLPSVFERFELEHGVECREPDGSIVRIDSHMCRRLFVTSGLAAGATSLDIARWQGREHIGDLRSYDQRSMAEKVDAVKDAIMTGRLKGQVAQAYVALADDVRDAWLDGQVQAMHVTPLGLCIHDFSATPCPLALNCVKECKDYLHDPTDSAQVQQLVQLQRRTREGLDRLRPEVASGRIAASWVEEQERTLRNVERILAVQVPPGGGLVQPFPDGASRFRPLISEN